MDAALKQKAKRRILTLISKVNELKFIGHEDSDLNDALPELEGFEQDLMATYAELEYL